MEVDDGPAEFPVPMGAREQAAVARGDLKRIHDPVVTREEVPFGNESVIEDSGHFDLQEMRLSREIVVAISLHGINANAFRAIGLRLLTL